MIATLLCVLAAPAQAASHPVIVMDETGRPIQGARVLGVHEEHTPVWGQRWSKAAGVTGADGRTELPVFTGAESYSWLMVEAEGYGGRGRRIRFEEAESEFRLMPEVPITLFLVDFMGRPLALAHVGVAFGCGHTPDIVSATTGPDGLAALRGVAPYSGDIDDVFVVHPRVSMVSYDSVPFGDMVEGVARLYCDPGSLLEGRLSGPDGKPAIGYAVGNDVNHRGQWAITDERGEFRLFGCDPRPGLIRVLSPEGESLASFDGARRGVYRTLALDGTQSPEEFVDGQADTKHATRQVSFEISAAQPIGLPEGVELPGRLRWIPVEIWDPVTGRSFQNETNEEGKVTMALPAGEYRVEVGGHECAYRAHDLGLLVVATGGDNTPITKAFQLPAPRACMLDVAGLREGEDVWIETEGGHYASRAASPLPFLIPSGLWSAHIDRRTEDGGFRRIQLDVPRELGPALTLRCP